MELGFVPGGVFSGDIVGRMRIMVGRADVVGAPLRARVSPYLPQICAGYEGCRAARAYGAGMRSPVDWVF